jgi:ring-1,2-phenylacetyl-CoA epoxidase subunit PaaD
VNAAAAAARPDTAQVWAWLADVPDPELPMISIVDLGIVRDVQWQDEACVVTLTPTYCGCPATEVIAASVLDMLRARGIARATLRTQLAPAWSTDWISESGRAKLQAAGIAPPSAAAPALPTVRVADIGRAPPLPACPRCGGRRVQLASAFGSTPCKAIYRCQDCLEPFDHFKPH